MTAQRLSSKSPRHPIQMVIIAVVFVSHTLTQNTSLLIVGGPHADSQVEPGSGLELYTNQLGSVKTSQNMKENQGQIKNPLCLELREGRREKKREVGERDRDRVGREREKKRGGGLQAKAREGERESGK